MSRVVEKLRFSFSHASLWSVVRVKSAGDGLISVSSITSEASTVAGTHRFLYASAASSLVEYVEQG